jgi:hypothetical protein
MDPGVRGGHDGRQTGAITGTEIDENERSIHANGRTKDERAKGSAKQGSRCLFTVRRHLRRDWRDFCDDVREEARFHGYDRFDPAKHSPLAIQPDTVCVLTNRTAIGRTWTGHPGPPD